MRRFSRGHPSSLLNVFFLVIMLFGVRVPSSAQAGGEPIVIGNRVGIHSKVSKETRSLLIATPDGYDAATDRYPVLYLLDGEDNFVHVAGIVQFLAETERIPPMIVVGIENTERSRDLTPPTQVEIESRFHPKNGGADAFLQFVSSELIPYIDQHYRTRSYKVLVGHSLGGLFAVYTLASNPRLFNAYIAIDPTLSWNNQSALAKAETTIRTTKELTSDLYITVTEENDDVHRLREILKERDIKGLRWTFKQMPDETHTSIVHQSVYSGLDSIFDGWHLASPLKLYDQGGLEAIHRHFAEGGKRYGYNQRLCRWNCFG